MPPTKFQFIWECGFRGEDFFRNQPIKNKNGLWWPCLLTDQNYMSNLYREPSIWPSGFRGEKILKIGQSETRITCGGHVC
jgi:hypothetical protein